MAAPLPVICLAGPTGCGKTAAALALAEALKGEVINADSRQVYSDFPLITAQPSPEERACCPHHLYGFLPTEQKISAGRWADQAVAEAKAVLARGHVPLLVGGTGLYFQGLLHGIAEIPAIDPAITAALTARRPSMPNWPPAIPPMRPASIPMTASASCVPWKCWPAPGTPSAGGTSTACPNRPAPGRCWCWTWNWMP